MNAVRDQDGRSAIAEVCRSDGRGWRETADPGISWKPMSIHLEGGKFVAVPAPTISYCIVELTTRIYETKEFWYQAATANQHVVQPVR